MAFRMSASFFGAHSLQPPKAPRTGGLGQLVDGTNVEGGIEQGDRLRPDSLQPKEIEDGRWKFLEQLLMEAACAG